MSLEGQLRDQKSLQYLDQMSEIVCDCIGFANASGGTIAIGIPDKQEFPPEDQKISNEIVDSLTKRISQLSNNLSYAVSKEIALNGSEFIAIQLSRSVQPASTSDGKYLIRSGDETRPMRGDELARFMTDRPSFNWELSLTSHPTETLDVEITNRFIQRIRESDRVSKFVKDKTDPEILAHYQFVRDGRLTNLGVLCIGTSSQRAQISTAPVIQVIKFDSKGAKVQKWLWDNHMMPIWELADDIWSTVPDWKESYEITDRMVRQNIPIYDEVVVRELLVNALVHRPYNQGGDLFLNLYDSHLEFHNPGLLPIGVTPENILHANIRRNQALAQIFHDLKLMEREGSGYDKIFETLVASGKALPVPEEIHDRVKVTVTKRIIDSHIIIFMNAATDVYQLSQRERICLGVLAQHRAMNVMMITKVLNLHSAADLEPWIAKLVKEHLVQATGKGRSHTYTINPEAFKTLNFTGRTHLGAIPEARLKELILEDIRVNQPTALPALHARIGAEIAEYRVRKMIEALVDELMIVSDGNRRWRKYSLVA